MSAFWHQRLRRSLYLICCVGTCAPRMFPHNILDPWCGSAAPIPGEGENYSYTAARSRVWRPNAPGSIAAGCLVTVTIHIATVRPRHAAVLLDITLKEEGWMSSIALYSELDLVIAGDLSLKVPIPLQFRANGEIAADIRAILLDARKRHGSSDGGWGILIGDIALIGCRQSGIGRRWRGRRCRGSMCCWRGRRGRRGCSSGMRPRRCDDMGG